MKRRIFSMLLAVMLLLTTVDITAFAQPIEDSTVEMVTEEESLSVETETSKADRQDAYIQAEPPPNRLSSLQDRSRCNRSP